jgi:two-component system, cell cycle sensor histidine kinase and response regulator CckA
VEIDDTGAGMTPDVLARAFEPFFTTKDVGVGSGLGLSICRGIITGLGGQIVITSEVGRGTSVRIVLLPYPEPAEPAMAAAALPPSPPSTPLRSPRQPTPAATAALETSSPARRARIMVVDDEPQVAKVVGRLLHRDHDVTIKECGQDALEHITSGARFNAIVCDVMMPNREVRDSVLHYLRAAHAT